MKPILAAVKGGDQCIASHLNAAVDIANGPCVKQKVFFYVKNWNNQL
jgi:hypothetical protein